MILRNKMYKYIYQWRGPTQSNTPTRPTRIISVRKSYKRQLEIKKKTCLQFYKRNCVPYLYVKFLNYTRNGRMKETEFIILATLTNCLGHLKSRFFLCICKHNSKQLTYWNLYFGCPQTVKRLLQMVIRLILSAYHCSDSTNYNLSDSFDLFILVPTADLSKHS